MQQQADALIMFSCVSRYLSFGVVMKEELEQVQKFGMRPWQAFFPMVNMENQKPVNMIIIITLLPGSIKRKITIQQAPTIIIGQDNK
ncbi:MAG: hypothetical protein WDM90_05015 [Ferruginibacter sp.]